MRKEVIGDATLYLADCREVLPTLAPVDTVVTSPPYNCGKEYGTASDELPLDKYREFLRQCVFSFKPVRLCLNVANYIGKREQRIRTADVIREVSEGHNLIDEIIWDKGPANGSAWGHFPRNPRIRAQHEVIYIYGDGPLRADSEMTWDLWPVLTTSIWRIVARVDLTQHPAQMPKALSSRLISLYTPRGGTVVDQFMGSGTTGVSAIEQGRKFIGIEIDPGHFSTACLRIEAAHRSPGLFSGPGAEQMQIDPAA